MSDRQHTRLMLTAVMVGLLMATYARCMPQSAHAESTQKLQPGEQCVARPVTVPSLVVSGASIAHRLAEARAGKRCGKALSECTRRAVRATRPEPQWRIGLRWFVTGAAVVGAFVLGVAL